MTEENGGGSSVVIADVSVGTQHAFLHAVLTETFLPVMNCAVLGRALSVAAIKWNSLVFKMHSCLQFK